MHETAFTVSVDATAATTGISTAERDMTIKILGNPISQPCELVMPGHIFPLIAKEGGMRRVLFIETVVRRVYWRGY